MKLIEIGNLFINPEYITHLEVTSGLRNSSATKVNFIGGGSVVVETSRDKVVEFLNPKPSRETKGEAAED